MSLFENPSYEWRETYFVFCHETDPPVAAEIAALIAELGHGYEASAIREDENGQFESVTIFCHTDNAAMDISYLAGDDVASTMQELPDELNSNERTAEEKQQIRRILTSDARYDIYHFEKKSDGDTEETPLDPGAMLIVINSIAARCNGVAIDPQSGELL